MTNGQDTERSCNGYFQKQLLPIIDSFSSRQRTKAVQILGYFYENFDNVPFLFETIAALYRWKGSLAKNIRRNFRKPPGLSYTSSSYWAHGAEWAEEQAAKIYKQLYQQHKSKTSDSRNPANLRTRKSIYWIQHSG